MKSNLRLAGFAGFLGIAFGAFGAHLLKERLAQFGTAWIWEKAVFYHLIHAVALLALALGRPTARWVPALFAAGIVIFSGSLYVLALTNERWLGRITPFGGGFFLAGWLVLVCCKGAEPR